MEPKCFYVSKTQLTLGEKIWQFQYAKNNADLLYFVAVLLAKTNMAILESAYSIDWYLSIRGIKQILPSVLIEIIFERVRGEEFKDKPNRLDSVHLFSNFDDASIFRKNYREDKGYIYTAKIINGILFRGDMEFVNPGIDLKKDFQEEVSLMAQRARDYWQGNLTKNPIIEILVKGDVIVDGLIDAK